MSATTTRYVCTKVSDTHPSAPPASAPASFTRYCNEVGCLYCSGKKAPAMAQPVAAPPAICGCAHCRADLGPSADVDDAGEMDKTLKKANKAYKKVIDKARKASRKASRKAEKRSRKAENRRRKAAAARAPSVIPADPFRVDNFFAHINQ